MNISQSNTSKLTEGSVRKGASLSEDDDDFLVQKAQRGDTEAFNTLVIRHRAKIYSMILNMVRNEADAWDLSQESFIKAWRALPKFQGKAQFSTWLFRISHNVVYDWIRKRPNQTELKEEIVDSLHIESSAPTSPKQELSPDVALEKQELRNHIEQAIAKLSPKHREVILLREVHGFDYKEIASITKSSVGTVMSRIHYARQTLQARLKDIL